MAALRQPITAVVIAFWFFFWLLNGLDKFFARQDVGFVRWWGNHRVEKFSMYFDKLQLDPTYVQLTLIFAGLIEFIAAGFFVWAAVRLFQGRPGVAYRTDIAITVSIVVFLGFTVFDVIVGDRAELLEHSTYIGVLLISFLAVAAESFFQHLRDLDSPSTLNRHYPPETQ
ncbi:hypothetical protein LP7551_05274 [Roseibium album]|jgi:hypothetical protein|nr:hypothetical protein LP7551_05274 [Roseibium album]